MLETTDRRDFAQFYEDIPNTDFPILFSDDQFADAMDRRIPAERSEHDRWDNKAILDRSRKTDGLPESTIEQRFQHIAKHLAAMWGSEACTLYLQRLLIADHEKRQGFPPEVMEDLILLDRINTDVCVAKKKKTMVGR